MTSGAIPGGAGGSSEKIGLWFPYSSRVKNELTHRILLHVDLMVKKYLYVCIHIGAYTHIYTHIYTLVINYVGFI